MGNSTNQGTQPYKYTGKELDMEHGLNLYDFEARTYDPAIGRFTSVDPMAEKYYNVSPYAYCLNNPVRFVDPTGMWIVGTNGKAATYDSKNGWSANASKDIIRIGNAMMLTPVGKEVLKTMIGTEYGISINMDPGVSSHNPERLGGAEIFTNTTSGKIAKVDITLYEGKIKEHLDYYQKMGNTHGAEGNTEKAQLLLKQQPTLTERIGQIAVHEGEHATNPDAQDKIVGKEKAEAQAVKKEIQAIKQTSVFNRSLPLFKFERINE
jgi:RHS repeat-associated protein